MSEPSKARVIELLEQLVTKQDELLKKMAASAGSPIRESNEEENEEYRKYVRSKLHGSGNYPYPG
jgi:hypothetical protein